MSNEPSVLIMMAAYNGAIYIKEQIYSIIGQSYDNWKLVIQDDGSTDKTVDIIQGIKNKDTRIELLYNEGIHGAYYNFHSLINKCKQLDEYDYYMFCDHDDIWNSNKISKLLKALSPYTNKNIPALAYANMDIVDGFGDYTGKTIDDVFKSANMKKWDSFYNHMIYGCNVMLNAYLFNTVPPIDISNSITKILCHDNLYVKYAAVYGEIIYVNESLMKYRRYGSNVTAEHDYNYGVKKIIKRVLSFNSFLKSHARTYQQTLYTIELILKNDTNITIKNDLEEIAKSINKGGLYANKVFVKYNISCGLNLRTMIRRLILVSGLYKRYLDD